MFGIGMPELLVILVVALVVLGPKRLPEVARTLGKALAEFKRQSTDIMEEFQSQMRVEEESTRRAEKKAAAAAPAAPAPVATEHEGEPPATPKV
jgi:Tat protein translocase TatB subunit